MPPDGALRRRKGPPCAYEWSTVFIAHFEDRTRSVRRFWARQRRLAQKQAAARE